MPWHMKIGVPDIRGMSVGCQYHVMPLEYDDRLSYLRSESIDDLTEIWKL